MATVTGFTAERMQAIEDSAITGGAVGPSGSPAGHLILTRHDGVQIDAGSVIGPTGPVGPAGPLAVGTHAARPASPTQGQAYFETDTKKLFLCYTAGTWKLFSTDDTWTAVTGGIGYSNSWTDYATGYSVVGYRLSESRVFLRGAMKSGTLGSTAFTLPTGYRPPTTVDFPIVTEDGVKSIPAVLAITSGGAVSVKSFTTQLPYVASNAFVSLEGVNFDTQA